MNKMIFACLGWVFSCGLAFAYEADQIGNEFLGFSEDGKYFAYSTSGQMEGSGEYRALTFVVETSSGKVEANVESRADYESVKGTRVAMWRLKNMEGAKTLLEKYKIKRENGVELTVKSAADMTLELAFNGKRNRFDLKLIQPVYECADACPLSPVCRMLQLVAHAAEHDKTWKYNKGWRYGSEQIVFADQSSAPKERACVDSYKLVRLGASKASGDLWGVFMFQYHRAGVEGGSFDYFVVSKKLVSAL